jgi:Glycosyl transferase family 2
MQEDSLTIVTVAKEPLDITLRFVAWHREQGADHVRIYFDDPDDPAIGWLEHLDWVTAIRCTAEFWQSIGVDPELWFTKRQNAALTHGYRAAEKGWVAVMDADELLFSRAQPIRSFLSGLPPEIRSVRLATAEVVHSDVTGQHFRTAMNKVQCHALYGEASALVKRNGGLVGHVLGKSITRAALDVAVIRQHFAVQPDGTVISDRTAGHEEGTFLLHLFDSGYDSWRTKLLWRMNSWGFTGRMAEVLRQLQESGDEGEADLRALYDLLHYLSPERLAMLQGFGSYLEVPEDLMAPARRQFPEALMPGA